jgi:hypothetical protein
MKYRIESYYRNEWYKIADYVTRQWAQGVLWATHHDAPRLAYRVVRIEDGKVTDERPANDEVSIGMIAGFPTAEQYELAAARALAKAKAIRERELAEARRAHDRAEQP